METENRAHKHLSLQECYDIEDGLNKSYTVSVIARKLDRDRSTIAKEIKKHPELNVVELDSVHGSNKTGNVMLTMLFRNCKFMLIKLMPECRQECVKKVFDDLTEQLGIERFQELFPVILTDNGSEFKNAIGIEYDGSEIQRSRVFSCDPLASWQKGKLEKNHEYIQKPKNRRFLLQSNSM